MALIVEPRTVPFSRRRGRWSASAGIAGAVLCGPILLGPAGTALAGSAPMPGPVALGSPTSGSPTSASPEQLLARGFASVRASARPSAIARAAASRVASHRGTPAPLFGQTTTYYALQADAAGSSAVRFRTDGRAHVSGRTVLTTRGPGAVLAPTSSVNGTVVMLEADYAGEDVVTVDSRGVMKRLTNDGHSAFGLLTSSRRVVFVTTRDNGEANGLAVVGLDGRGRRWVYREKDGDAVLSLPTLSPSGRTAYLVRNVFDRRGLPQSTLLTIDVASGRVSMRPLPGINYVVSMSASPNGRTLAFVGYRAADNIYARWIGFRAEADVLGASSGAARRVAWVDQPYTVFSRGSSRLVVGADGRLVSVGVTSSAHDPLYGTEGLSLPVLAR